METKAPNTLLAGALWNEVTNHHPFVVSIDTWNGHNIHFPVNTKKTAEADNLAWCSKSKSRLNPRSRIYGFRVLGFRV